MEAVRHLTVGAAADGPADIGPLIHDRATSVMVVMVDVAVACGARLQMGGNFFAPTILTDVLVPMRL